MPTLDSNPQFNYPHSEYAMMSLHEKIQFMRTLRGWSQEEMAEKLSMSVSGYAKIERGGTDIPLSRLEQIAQMLGIELQNLFNPEGKVLINLGEINGASSCYVHTCNVTKSGKEFEHEIEKLHLIVEQQAKEINYLKEIIELMKKRD